MVKHFRLRNGLDPSRLQILITTVEHLPGQNYFGNIRGNSIFNQFVRWLPRVDNKLVESSLQRGRKMNFHNVKTTEPPPGSKVIRIVTYSTWASL